MILRSDSCSSSLIDNPILGLIRIVDTDHLSGRPTSKRLKLWPVVKLVNRQKAYCREFPSGNVEKEFPNGKAYIWLAISISGFIRISILSTIMNFCKPLPGSLAGIVFTANDAGLPEPPGSVSEKFAFSDTILTG